MTDVDGSVFPANARLETITFDDQARVMHVVLRGAPETRDVPVDDVLALFGGRIRHDSVTTMSTGGGGISFGKIAMTAATGIPMGITKGGPKEKAVVGQELHHALALRVANVADLWYLLAQSFNFRKALGPDSTYSSENNLRLFVKRLAAFAPHAPQDAYIAATVANTPLPPPVDSLLDFFRSAST